MLRYNGLYVFNAPGYYDEWGRGQSYLRFYQDGTVLVSGGAGTPEQTATVMHQAAEWVSKGRYAIIDGVLSFYALLESTGKIGTPSGVSEDGWEWQITPELLITFGEGAIDDGKLKLRCHGAYHRRGKFGVQNVDDEAIYSFVEVTLP